MEVDEVWLESLYRKRGVGLEMACGVADIAIESLREIERRLTEAGTEAESLEFDVSANVYSQSGKKFLFDVASSLEIGLSTLELTALRVSAVGCNPRW